MIPSLTVRLPVPIDLYIGPGKPLISNPVVTVLSIRLLHIERCKQHTKCHCRRESLEDIEINSPRIGNLIPHLFGGMKNEWLSDARTTRIFSIAVLCEFKDGKRYRLDLRQTMHARDKANWMASALAIDDYYREWLHVTMFMAAVNFIRRHKQLWSVRMTRRTKKLRATTAPPI